MRSRLIQRLLRRKKQIFACISLCLLITLFCKWGANAKPEVVILMWTKFWEMEEDHFLRILYNGRNDSDKMCFNGVKITYDRGQLERAAAIVIYSYLNNASDLPKTRRPDQLWIHFGTESPTNFIHYTPNFKPFNNLFNWTMTYRKDSDIFAPYGNFVALDTEVEAIYINGMPLNDFIARKTGQLAGVISNCKTLGKRENFIKKLCTEGNMTVDIFGACGKPTCNRWNMTCDRGKWWRELGAKYKFYFAAENSICTDYITEKFWRALEIGVVPLVYGGANYSRFAPPHSFIDVRDFKSARDVAKFLKELDKDETEYKKYFEWRKKYKVRVEEGTVDTWIGFGLQGWCDLAKRVKEFRIRVDSDPSALQELSKTIHDLDGWWTHEAGSNRSACGRPPI